MIATSLPSSPGVRRPPVTALFQFLGSDGGEYRDLAEAVLSDAHFSIRELRFDVHPVFPAYAEQRLAELVTDVAIVASKSMSVGILAQRDELAITEDD